MSSQVAGKGARACACAYGRVSNIRLWSSLQKVCISGRSSANHRSKWGDDGISLPGGSRHEARHPAFGISPFWESSTVNGPSYLKSSHALQSSRSPKSHSKAVATR